MSTLKTHNLQSPDAGSVNIAMTPNAGMVVTGISTFTGAIDANGDLDVDGHTELDNINISGVSTHVGLSQFQNTINLTHASAGQNYIYFNEDLQFAKNGTGTRLKIDSSGNVLTSGNTQLFGSNTSDGSDNKAIMINGGGSTSDTRGGYLLVHGNEHSSNPGITRLHAGNVGTAYIAFNTSGNERLRITSAGLVGVGQATPTHMLHVDSSNASDSTATAFFKGRIIRFDGAASAHSPRLNFSLDGTDKAQILLHRTNVGLDIATLAAEPIKFKINSVEKLRITSAGTPFVKADGTEPVNQAEAGHYSGSGYNAGNALGLMVKRAIHVSDADTKGVGGMFLSHTRNVACNGTTYNMFTLHNREGTFVGDIYVGFSGSGSGAVRKYTFACVYNANNLTSVLFNRRSNNDNLTVNIVSSNTSHFFQVIPTKSGGAVERVSMTIVGAACGRNDGAGGDFYTVSYN